MIEFQKAAGSYLYINAVGLGYVWIDLSQLIFYFLDYEHYFMLFLNDNFML